jgi:Leucine Rich Repeat
MQFKQSAFFSAMTALSLSSSGEGMNLRGIVQSFEHIPTPATSVPLADTIQMSVNSWISQTENENTISIQERAQLIGLANLYFATNGTNWHNSSNWLSSEVSECNWYNQAFLVCDSNGTLIQLELAANNLRGVLPAELANLDKLQELNLSHNFIHGEIPTSLQSLDNLMALDLFNNSLTGLINGTLLSLPHLTVFNVGMNNLTDSIPSEIGSVTTMEHLFLHANSLSGSLPSHFGLLTSLKTLWLFNNSKIVGAVPSALENLVNLTSLKLENTGLQGIIPPGLCTIPDLTFTCGILCGCGCICQPDDPVL